MDRDTEIGGRDARFPKTRVSVVTALRGNDPEARRRATGAVVAIYWKPLYKYLRLRWQRSNDEAKDLIQGFLANALEREALSTFDPSRAGLRTFLRLLLDRYLANEAKAASRQKRGGDLARLDFEEAEAEFARVLAEGADPEELLRREWVRALFSDAVAKLEAELLGSGRESQFRVFHALDLDDGERRPSYRDLAVSLGVTELKITNDLAAARRRFRAIVLAILREVTGSEEEFREEARAILGTEP